MSKVRALYHIVFSTKNRRPTIGYDSSKLLYNYIWGIVKRNNSFLHRIGGVGDHVHMAVDLSASISLAEFMKQVKGDSSTWLKHNPQRFRLFEGWSKEYYASTFSVKELEVVKAYIANQNVHHLGVNFAEELEYLSKEFGVDYYADDLLR